MYHNLMTKFSLFYCMIYDVQIDGQTVRLYMPKNVTVTKFGIWERCAGQEGSL